MDTGQRFTHPGIANKAKIHIGIFDRGEECGLGQEVVILAGIRDLEWRRSRYRRQRRQKGWNQGGNREDFGSHLCLCRYRVAAQYLQGHLAISRSNKQEPVSSSDLSTSALSLPLNLMSAGGSFDSRAQEVQVEK